MESKIEVLTDQIIPSIIDEFVTYELKPDKKTIEVRLNIKLLKKQILAEFLKRGYCIPIYVVPNEKRNDITMFQLSSLVRDYEDAKESWDDFKSWMPALLRYQNKERMYELEFIEYKGNIENFNISFN